MCRVRVLNRMRYSVISERKIMKNFEGFGLSQELNNSLAKMNYTVPTPVQEKAIPFALQGRDILGSAQTGTGKTAAFSIPLVEAVLRNPHGNALVLTPTRELAKQVMDVIHQLLGPQSPIKTAFVIGGEPMGKQFQQLRQRPRIIVGTPGRINDHLERGLKLTNTNFLVLDETDRMLDMGFGVQLDRILKYLPAQRQTLMFSATLPRAIVQMSAKYLTQPERVAVGETNVVAPKIKQEIVHIAHEKKYEELVQQLYKREGSVIIFSKTKYGSEKMATKLCRDGFEADALHGDLRQNQRTKVMNKFRQKQFRILVATDIAARGLDVPHIEHVINYDLPQVAEDYIHRMGRTARAGAEGSALCFISPQEADKWRAIERLLNPSAAGPERKEQGRKEQDRHNHKPYGKRGGSKKRRFKERPRYARMAA
jgi:ATP-dependent RNA helicase DeaD